MLRTRTLIGLLLAALGGALPVCAYEPAVNYQLHCMGCHLADGSGDAQRLPSMRGTLVPFSGLPAGRDYLLRVPGVSQSPLADADLAVLMNWMVRNLSDVPVPSDFVEYTAAEVGRARRQPLAQVTELRARLLELTR
ncbi:MAG: cytochrome c, class I [Gammaproteobacteria bacterium]|nr:cytochrome c, class I [Gammaproteobacteria bacterium]